jgi:hypothetical protein
MEIDIKFKEQKEGECKCSEEMMEQRKNTKREGDFHQEDFDIRKEEAYNERQMWTEAIIA